MVRLRDRELGRDPTRAALGVKHTVLMLALTTLQGLGDKPLSLRGMPSLAHCSLPLAPSHSVETASGLLWNWVVIPCLCQAVLLHLAPFPGGARPQVDV